MPQEPVAPVTALDVRAMLAQGGEPFDLIMTTVSALPSNGVLELTAPFEPGPLYPILRHRGFAPTVVASAPGTVVVRFAQTGIAAHSLVGEVHANCPAAAPVLAAHGLDLCCGGSRSLEAAAKAHGIELDLLLASLQDAVVVD